MNTPYVKEYEKGILTNPITTGLFHKEENRAARRSETGRVFSNKKGIQLVVTYIGKGKFYKATKHITFLNGKTLVNYN